MIKPTKILYLITKSNWGGAGKYVYDLATAAKGIGLEVTVAAGKPSGEGELLTRLHQAGIKTIPLPSVKRDIQFLGEFNNLWQLIKLFKKERPDIIHLNSSKIGGLGALAGRLAGVPKIIFTAHNWAFNEDRNLLSKALIALSHWVGALLCHQIITVSIKNAAQILNFPSLKNKITVIYNGLDIPQFLNKKEARVKLSPEDVDTIWLGTIAELHKNKGLDILLLAFKQVLARVGGLSLIIMGEGEERENLAHLIAKLNLTNNVKLLGRVEQAATYLSALDLFILPSRTEALPYAVLEAGAAGLPVIVSRVGGIPEIIDDEESGLLVTAGNYKDLALAIEKLLTHKDLAKKYAKNLQNKITTEFTQKNMLDQTFALYQK